MEFKREIFISCLSVFIIILGLGFVFYIEPWLGPYRERWLLYTYSGDCEFETLRAEEDFKNNNLKLVSWGIRDGGTDFRAKLLEDRFSIKTVYGGCVVIERIDCYNKRMFELIVDKYGADTLYKTHIEAYCLGEDEREKNKLQVIE